MTVSQCLKHFAPQVLEAIELCAEPGPPDWPDAFDYLALAVAFLCGILFTLIILI